MVPRRRRHATATDRTSVMPCSSQFAGGRLGTTAAFSGSGGDGISLPVTELADVEILGGDTLMSSAVTLAIAVGQSLTCSIVKPSSMPSA